MNLKLSKTQYQFITSNTKGTIFLSCIGGGKSYSLVLRSILNGFDNIRTLFVSFSVANLKDNILPVFYELFERLGKKEGRDFNVVKSPHITINIKNTGGTFTEILLRTGSHPDRLRGLSVGSFMIDEARELYNRDIFDILIGRLRQPGLVNLQWYIGTTTRSKDWVYDLLEQEGLTGIFEERNRVLSNDYLTVLRTTIDEVPHLTDEYVDYLKRNYSSRFALQELYATILDDIGEIISPQWFNTESSMSIPSNGVRFWDLAVSVKTTADYSVGTLLSRTKIGNGYSWAINNMSRVKKSYPDLKKHIIETAISDGKGIVIGLEKAGQQLAIIDDLRRCRELSGYTIRTLTPTKDKITRAYPWASQAEMGRFTLQKAAWNKVFFDECAKFSAETVKNGIGHDDMIDSVSGAFELLNRPTNVMLTNF